MLMTPQNLISDNLELVALPAIVNRLNEMVDDPECTAADIGEVISQDVALSARLLKIVNSPFYNFPSQIDTISMAITIVGTRQLRDLVLATMVTNHFRRIPHNLVDVDVFWHHNLACGTAARVIADELGVGNTERFFVAGMLHDIGKLVMYLVQPELSRHVRELSEQPDADLANLENSAFGFNHAELGGELLRSWKLPDSLIEPVEYHHNPLGASHFQIEAAAVHLGNAIANTIEPFISREDDLPIIAEVWGILGLSSSILDELISTSQEQLDSVLQLLYYSEAA